MPNSDFGLKLDLVLRTFSMSRGRLAVELKVDKSVVGRWVAGTVMPSAHNLAALTSFIARRCSAFTMLDWDREFGSFAGTLGIDPALARRKQHPADAEPDSVSFPAALVETARHQTQRRGKSYQGIYEVIFPSTTRLGSFIKYFALIERRNGLLWIRMGGMGLELSGWLFLVANLLYAVLGENSDDSPMFLVLNGINTWRVDAMDGVFAANSADILLAPLATPIFFELVERLDEDAKANEARFSALMAGSRFLGPSELREELRNHLLPNVGPAAAAAGTGDLLLWMPASRSLARGTDIRD